MIRSAVGKVMWVGRATVFFVGLAVILALVFGVVSMAAAHTGVDTKLFHLGHSNTSNAISRLVGSVAGPMLRLDNNSTGTGATALDLQVEPGKVPMTVNSSTKVDNLNADSLDGKDGFMDDTTYQVIDQFTGSANTYAGTTLSCDVQDKVLSGGYYLFDGRTSNVTADRASGNTYEFEVVSGASAETATIFALCADQDGDGAGTAAANVADSPQARTEEERAAGK